MKRLKSISLWFLGLSLCLALVSVGQRKQALIEGERSSITFINRPLNSFISKEEIAKEIEIAQVNAQENGEREINISLLEESLDNHPSIKKAEVYSNLDGSLSIEIWQHQPLARFISKKRSEYFIEGGALMPLSPHFSEKVPLVTGSIALAQKEKIAEFWGLTQSKDIFKNIFGGLHCAEDSTWTLYPAKGNYQVELGKAEDLEQKMENLENFFKFSDVLKDLKRLESINLEFNNQVICRKKQV